jgi:hypothetical protein
MPVVHLGEVISDRALFALSSTTNLHDKGPRLYNPGLN